MTRSSPRTRLALVPLPVLLALALALVSFADTKEAPKQQAASPSDSSPGGKNGVPNQTVAQAAKRYVVWNIEFANEDAAKAFSVDGAHVLYRTGKFVDLLLPLTADRSKIDPEVFKNLGNAWKGVKDYDWVEEIAPPEPLPIPAASPLKGKGSQKVVRDGVGDLKGKDVIIAILDTGLDFRHPDFIEDDGKTSRLLYFWDTTRTHDPTGMGTAAPVSYPNKQPYGTVFSRDDLSKDLAAGTQPIGPVDDQQGHGTSCAGVAAGNGRGDRNNKDVIGVAPQATLIGVRIHGQADNGYLVNAVLDWLDKVAKEQKKPLVVSCSWSKQEGARDASFIRERCLSERFPETGEKAQGRIVCFSAGNNAAEKIHARVQFEDETSPAVLTWSAKQETRLTLCVDGIEGDQVVIKPQGETKLPAAGIKKNYISGTTLIYQWVPAGTGGLTLHAKARPTAPLRADAYFPKTNGATQFTCEGVVNAVQLGTPGTAVSAITVGSYDFNDTFHFFKQKEPATLRVNLGGISYYSNAGYLRQTRHLGEGVQVIKPDLSAPGMCFTAPAAEAAATAMKALPEGDRYQRLSNTNQQYCFFNGTSAATPYTAGVIALLLQKKPTLTTAELRKMLGADDGLTKDDFTGAVPNVLWGRGKLDYAAVERLIKKLD